MQGQEMEEECERVSEEDTEERRRAVKSGSRCQMSWPADAGTAESLVLVHFTCN